MKYAVTVISPPNYPHSAVFAEVAETILGSLIALGHDSVLTTDGLLPNRQHIVLGSNLLVSHSIPISDNAILFNLEQVAPDGVWFTPAFLAILKRHTVWDYSYHNAKLLEGIGIKVAHVLQIGYLPELSRFKPIPESESDTDIFFAGSMSARRRLVFSQMADLGLRVDVRFGLYGKARDDAMSRAKLVLNLHQHEAKILEMVRISYLLANHCTVLSEHGADAAEDATLAGGVAFASYANLAQRARELVDSPDERRQLSRRGFEIMRSRSAVQYLHAALMSSHGLQPSR